ncbi:MAG: T9SS type A sorting domain-containing protein [Sphaerospermopsis sp.]|nr:T9SS type A sorting domain-containing protein [Sphaerospermopsis sp.]
MKKNILHLLIFTCLMFGVNPSWGQSTNLVSWDFTPSVTSANYATSTTNQNGARTTALTNVTLSTISINGSGVSGVNANTFHRTSGWPTSSSTSHYLQFSITLTAGETFANQVCSVAVGAQVSSTSTAARDYTVTYGYGSSPTFATATNGAVTGTGTNTTNTTNIAIPAPGNTTTTLLTVRILVHGSTSGSGNFRIATIGLTGYNPLSSSPAINAGAATLPTFISSAVSTPSAEQSFSVSGTNLTNNITINPPTGYQVSTTSGSGFGSSVVLTQAGGTVASTTIYARFNPTTLADQVGGNITCTSTGATAQNVAVSGEVTNLYAGALAFIAFQGSSPDMFRMVALEDIPEGTRVQITDKSWDGSAVPPAFTSSEGTGVWTAPAGGVTRGTVIAFDADAGTASVGTGGIQSGLGSTGEQLFAYQGTLTTPTFITGFTSGSTIASGAPVSNQTWVPAGLTSGTNYLALGNTAGASSLNVATNNRTVADHRSFIHNATNWTTATSGSWPAWTFTFLADEPTTQPSFSAASSVGNNQMDLNFSGGNGTSYMVVMREASAVTATPTDATNYTTVSGSVNFSTATELSAGQRIVYNGTTATGTVTVTNLAAGTTYHYAIYAYNGTTTTANFYLTSPGTGSQLTTGSANSNASDIIIHGSFTEPSNIAYAANQENTNLTNANSIEVARFTLRDGGATTDGDANSTTLNAITFNVTNHSVLRRLALYNGTTELSEIAVTTGTATFSGLTLSAADNAAQDFSLRASFASTVTDNTQFSFAVSSATADPAGSTFAAADAGAAVSSTTSDRNRIEVTATLLAFVQQTSNVSTNTAMSPAPTVSANDALANRDLDYVTDMTATTTGTFGSATTTITPTAGLGTFSNLQFSAAATGRTIAVSSGSLTASGNSNTFDINGLLNAGDIAIIGYGSSGTDKFAFLLLADVPASTVLNFTDNAWTGSALNSNENTLVWTSPGSTLSAGTVVTITSTATVSSGHGSATGTISGLASGGDQLLCYRGTSGSPTFICAFSSSAWLTTGTVSNNTSYLPTGLTAGVTASNTSSSFDNGYYDRIAAGPAAILRSLVNNISNWTTSASSQTLPAAFGNSYATFQNTTTLAANTSISNISLESGQIFNIGAFTLTVNGTFSGAGTLSGGSSSNLTITGTSGTVNFDQTTPGTTNMLGNLTISGSGTTTIGNALNISSGATAGIVTVGAGATLATGGNLTLKSDASGTASIGNSAGTITGNVTVETFIPGGKRAYRLLGHPFSGTIALSTLIDNIHITGANGGGFDATSTNNPSAFSFNEATFNGTTNSGWSAFTNTANTIGAGQGTRILVRGPRSQSNLLDGTNPTPQAATLDFSGTVNQGNVNVAMGYTGASGANAGWNLIANPYASRVDIGSIIAGNRNSIANFSVWAPNNGTRGAYVTTSFGSAYIIPAGAAFFVQTGSAANFTFTEANKSTSVVSETLLKTDPFKLNALQLNVTSDDTIFWDQFVLRNREDAIETKDAMDANKMENPDVNFYSTTNNNDKFAIDHRPLTANSVINLGFNTTSDYHFTFKVANLDMPGYEVYLMDKFLNKQTLLTSSTAYHFTTSADANSKGLNRFQLVFNKVASGSQEMNISNNFVAYPNPASSEINISLTTANKGIYQFGLYNQLGKELTAGNFNFSSNPIQTLNIEALATGVYFIKVSNGDATQTIKFIK